MEGIGKFFGEIAKWHYEYYCSENPDFHLCPSRPWHDARQIEKRQLLGSNLIPLPPGTINIDPDVSFDPSRETIFEVQGDRVVLSRERLVELGVIYHHGDDFNLSTQKKDQYLELLNNDGVDGLIKRLKKEIGEDW